MTAVPRRALSALLVLMAGSSHALAQEIDWRTDYAKAVAEAGEKGRPLFIDVGSDNCYWCRQLEQRTFTDEKIRKLLAERFIPLKINGTKNTYLVQALRIQSYPTLVFAGNDGTIVGYKEGFQDAATLEQLMAKVLTTVGTPAWMTRDYEAAVKAIEANDPGRALTLLRSVAEDGKDRPIQARSREMIAELEKRAAAEAAAAAALASNGRPDEAAAAYERLDRTFPGTLAARQGRQALASLTNKAAAGDQDRARQAAELLEQARKDYQAGRYLICLDRCELLSETYADVAASKDATKLAEQIKDNPEWTRQACDQLSERLGLLYISLADSWLRKGQPQQAVYYLDRVVKMAPTARLVEQAQTRLTRLRGAPEAK